MLDEPLLQFLDAAAEECENGQFRNLGTYVEMQADELDILTLGEEVGYILEGPGTDTEFVLFQTRADVFVGMGIDVGVHADRNAGAFAHAGGQVVDYADFRYALAVETENARPQGGLDLLVGFADARVDDLLRVETGADGQFHFVAAYAICAQPVTLDNLEDTVVGIGFQRIVCVVTVLVDLALIDVQRLAQEVQVIEIKRGLDGSESFNLLFGDHMPFYNFDISCKYTPKL